MGRMYLSLDEVDDPVKEVELAHREAAGYWGTGWHSGSWATVRAVEVDSVSVLSSKEEAEVCVKSKAVFGGAYAVRYRGTDSKVHWIVGAWAAD